MKFELVEPKLDKGWNLQISFQPCSEVRESVLDSFSNLEVKRARPFLQGDCADWIMIEFWTENEDWILRAAEIIQENVLRGFETLS